MDQLDIVSSLACLPPDHVSEPYPWVGHIPFAFWLVEASRPHVLVELGTHSGNSYFAFCQAVKYLGLESKCFAVDCWRGDPQAGFYGEDIYRRVEEVNQRCFASFSTLMRQMFHDARDAFQDGSIDVLHIDGLHTYEAVSADFRWWHPKLSQRALVLLHDTNVPGPEFGVHRLFAELSAQYPTFQFPHSSGLGVVGVGKHLPARVETLLRLEESSPQGRSVCRCFGWLGQQILDAHLRLKAARDREERLSARLAALTAERDALTAENQHIHLEQGHLRRRLAEIENSLGWMLVRRSRSLRGRFLRDSPLPVRCWDALSRRLKRAMSPGG